MAVVADPEPRRDFILLFNDGACPRCANKGHGFNLRDCDCHHAAQFHSKVGERRRGVDALKRKPLVRYLAFAERNRN